MSPTAWAARPLPNSDAFTLADGFDINTIRPDVEPSLVNRLRKGHRARRKDLPIVVIVGGWVFMILHATVGILNAVGWVVLFAGGLATAPVGARINDTLLCFSVVGLLLQSAIHLVLYRLGDALTRGQKTAVYGLAVVSVVVLGLGILLLMTPVYVLGIGACLYVTLLCLPTLAAAISAWEKFT